MTDNNNDITIIQPDDWHVHLREGQLLSAVVDDTAKIFGKCIAMPNLKSPLIKRMMVKNYKNNIYANSSFKNLKVFVPCFLTDQIDLNDFLIGIKNNYFFGAKLYPLNATTNSSIGVNNLEKIFPALEILEEYNAPLLIHAEKPHSDISIFDREKYFIDDEMQQILKRFQNLKIVIEHISSEYGANFVNESNSNLASTITLHHLLLTKKDVFNGDINPYNFCMPVAKDEKDLIALRKFACSGNKKFFLGTDSAPHDVKDKKNLNKIKPGIYTSPIAIEMYTTIFEEENSLKNFEKFASINGSIFYNLPINNSKITLKKQEWINSEFTSYNEMKIKNFMGGQKIKWKVLNKKR